MKKLIIAGLLATMGTQAMAQDIIMRRPIPKPSGQSTPDVTDPPVTSVSCDDPSKSVLVFQSQHWRLDGPLSEPFTDGESCFRERAIICVRTQVYCADSVYSTAYPEPDLDSGQAVFMAAEQILPNSECEAFTGEGILPDTGA